jgi:hypothetical protein
VFTRDLCRRLVQGVSAMCLQHFHKCFVQRFHKAFIHFAKLCTQFVQVFLQGVYLICTSVFERLLQHLYMCS